MLISELIRWNDRFEARKEEVLYAIGQQLTLADLVLFPQVAFLVHCGYPIHFHPRIGKEESFDGRRVVFSARGLFSVSANERKESR